MLQLVRGQKGILSELMDDLSPYVECQKFPHGVLKEISDRHKCSKRTIQRYINKVKQLEYKRCSTAMT